MAAGEFGEGDGGRTHDFRVVGDIGEDSAFRGDLDAITDLEMSGETALAGDGNEISQLSGTGNADLRNEQTMLPDLHVVADLDQVIDLGPLPDHGLAESGAIDRRSGADFHIVLDPDNADLRDLMVLPLVKREPVAIGADDHAGMDDATTADARAVVDADVRIDDAIVADNRAGLDRDALENRDVIPDHDFISDDREMAEHDILAELRGRGDYGFRRDTFRHRPVRKPARHDPREREVGIVHANPPVINALEIFRNQSRAGFRGGEIGGVFAIAQEAELIALRLRKRSDPPDGAVAFPGELAGDEIDNFSHGNSRHRRECRGSGQELKPAALTNLPKNLNRFGLPALYRLMNKKILCSLMVAGSIALSGVAFAGSPSSYQVTGPITAVDDSMITVMKGKEKFEVARDSSTKVTGDLKVGEKVTIKYTMTAKEIEAKPTKTEKADKPKKDDKAGASPTASPKK